MKVFYRRESVLYNIQTNSPKDLIINYEKKIKCKDLLTQETFIMAKVHWKC